MALRRDGHGNYGPLYSNDATVSQLAQQDKIPWYHKPNLRLLYLLMVPTCLGVEMTSGFDMSMVNGLQAVPSWLEYFHHPHSTGLGLMAAAYPFGNFVTVPIVPFFVDKMGRRYPILIGAIISIIVGILQGSASNFTIFIVARLILGMANGFCVIAASSLIGELAYPKERAVMGSLFNCSFDIGGIAGALVTLGTFAMTSQLGWRIPSLLQVVPSLLQVCFIWFVPESPRWLVAKGRGSEAYAILVKYHAEGDKDSDFVEAEYSQIEQTLEAEMKVARMSHEAIFSTAGMRKRVIIATFLGLFTQWSGDGLISPYLNVFLGSIGIHDNRTKNIISLMKVSWSCMNGIVIALIVPRYPRRRMYLMCSISVFVVYTSWTAASAEYALTHNTITAQVALVLVFFYSPAYNLAFNSLTYPFLVELFPFHVRAKGIAVLQWWSRGAAFFNLFVNPIGVEAVGWRWYTVYCVWNAFQIVFIYFVFPETAGRTPEELTFLFEGEQEMLRHAEVETLHRRRVSGTYGTMEGERF